MPLLYYPAPGEIVICRYDDQVIEPEMRKTRPAMVVGPRLRGRGRLVTVVPLSTTEPSEMRDYHCRIVLPQPLPKPFDATVMWAKCDLVSSVSLDRLDRFRQARERDGGARRWTTGRVSPDQLRNVKRAVLAGLGFAALTNQV